MRIDSSTIGMESVRSYSSVSARVNRFSVTAGKQTLEDGAGALLGGFWQMGENSQNALENKKEGKKMGIQDSLEEIRNKMSNVQLNHSSISEMDDLGEQLRQLRQSCMDYLMRILFPDRYEQNRWETTEEASSGFGMNVRTLHYTKQYYFEETESTTFETQGVVRTADGREISFGIQLNMSRRFQEYYEEQVDFMEASLWDPLVINLEGNIADVSDQTFFFDIDGDGIEDEISRLIAGSGFLALDLNEDGKINDGSELFGTKSGNGFADLAKYDTDGNGFIDEGDEIFHKLKIWTIDKNGEPHLYSLAEKGVGAIGLMHTSTNFALTDKNNNTNAVIRNTGFFLYEDGRSGTVQHVDFAKH